MEKSKKEKIDITDFFFKAVKENKKETVKMLIDEGFDINTNDKYSWTVLILASKGGNTKIVKLLLEAGADVNIANEEGNTALIQSIINEDLETVKTLINAYADVNAVNKEGKSVLDIAKKYKNKEIVTVIKKEIEKNKQTKEKKEKVIRTKKSKDVFNSIKNNIKNKRLKNLLLKRIEKGISSYGTRLTTYNGRDALKDAHEEVLDAILYIWQKKMEVSSKDEETLHKLWGILNNLFYTEDVIDKLRETPSEKKEKIDKLCDALNKISLFK